MTLVAATIRTDLADYLGVLLNVYALLIVGKDVIEFIASTSTGQATNVWSIPITIFDLGLWLVN